MGATALDSRSLLPLLPPSLLPSRRPANEDTKGKKEGLWPGRDKQLLLLQAKAGQVWLNEGVSQSPFQSGALQALCGV